MIELQSLLKEAVDKMASDIFISVGVPPTLKINGQLIKVDDEKLNPETAKKMISELFKTEEDFLDFVKAGEKDFSTSLTLIIACKNFILILLSKHNYGICFNCFFFINGIHLFVSFSLN
mgnify:CR=1 FL=1